MLFFIYLHALKHIFNISLFIIIVFSSVAQNKADSALVETKVARLKTLINSNNDSVIYYLNELKNINSLYAKLEYNRLIGFNHMRKGAFETAISFFNEYIKLVNDSINQGAIDQLNRVAMCYKYMGSDTSFAYYTKANKLAIKANYHKGIADSYSGIGQIEELKGNYQNAIVAYLKSYRFFEMDKDSLGISTTFNNMGNVMYYQGNLDKALTYYKESGAIDKSMKNDKHLASSYGNIAMIFNVQMELDSALKYSLKAMAIFEKMQDAHTLGTIYNNIALVYFDMNDFEKALDYHFKSKNIKEKIKDKNGLATSMLNIGKVYVQQKKYAQATQYFHEALLLAQELNAPLLKMNVHKGLSRLYAENKQFEKALLSYKTFSEIEDSLNNIENKANIAQLQVQFETEQREKEINYLKADQKAHILELTKKTNQRNTVIIILVSLFFVLLFFILYWQQKQANTAKEIAINQDKINMLLKENEINYANAMIEGQEAERKRIAHDLHDRLGSMLSTVKLHFSSGKEESIEKGQKLLDASVEEVRKISHNLASNSLVRFGLIASLQSLCESIDSNNLKVSFIHHGIENRLNSTTEISIYRCVQELISNIIKHAKASKISIQIQRNDAELNLIVEDNGIGFDTSKVYRGIGLKNIISRIKSINGKINFDSVANRGTSVIIDIPIEL